MKKAGLILIIFMSLLSFKKASASHLMGGEITWSCVGHDSIMVKLVVYRDCNGIPLGTSPINFICDNTGSSITSITIAVGTPVDVTPICRTSCSRCQSLSCSFPYGVQRYTMQGVVKLSGAGTCCNVRISWSQSSRNAAITTMPGAGSDDLYIEAKLNRCLNPCDNSPSFTNLPDAILCVGQDFTFNNGALDTDVDSTGGLSDSLTYEWVPPLGGYGNNLAYSSPYSFNKPINFWGFPNDTLPLPQGFHLDHQTGDIKFRPMLAQVTVIALKINEFRNRVKIAEVTRDLEFIVISCTSNAAPTVTTPFNVISQGINASQTVTFDFSTSDPNSSDSVTITWNNAIPGATWTHTNGQTKHPTATLTWTPATHSSGTLPYNFTVTATDNACPVRAQFTQAYQIYVLHEIIKINPIDKRCIDGSNLYLDSFVTVNGKRSSKGKWTSPSAGLINGDTFNPKIAGASTPPGWKVTYEYYDSFTGKNYGASGYVTVFALPKPYAGKDDSICTGAKISLSGSPSSSLATWRGIGVEGSYPNWKFNPDITGIVDGGSYGLIYHYTDNNTCENEDTVNITVFKIPVAEAGNPMEFCVDADSINLTGTPVGGNWTGTGVTGNVFYPSKAKVGIYDLTYSYTNVICTSTDKVKYTVWYLPSVTAATQSGRTLFCRSEGLIQLNGQPSGAGGLWSGPGIAGNNFNAAIGADSTTDYTLRYEYTNTHNCKNADDLTVSVMPEPIVEIDPAGNKFCIGKPFSISATDQHADKILWSLGTLSDGTIIGPTNATSIGYNLGNGDLIRLYFWLKIKADENTHICAAGYDSIKVLISAVPIADFTGDPITGNIPLTVQFNESSTINKGTITNWEWSFGDGNFSADQYPVHTYLNTGKYSVSLKVMSNAGCADTLIRNDYINSSTGIENHNKSEVIILYPIPAHGFLTIEYSGFVPAMIQISDVLGNDIQRQMILPGKNVLNMITLKPGIYFLRFNNSSIYKLVIE